MKRLFVVSSLLLFVLAAIPCQAQEDVICACSKKDGTLRIVQSANDCKLSETPISWNMVGPQGLPGPQGPEGPPGPPGECCPVNVQVTFTGNIYYAMEGADVWGIEEGDAFQAVLTYNPVQPDFNSDPDIGDYFGYMFLITVQTSSGEVTFDAGTAYPVKVFDNNPDWDGTKDRVHNAGAGVLFSLATIDLNALPNDELTEVDWHTLFTLSDDPRIALRASNAAVVVEGAIDSVGVRIVP